MSIGDYQNLNSELFVLKNRYINGLMQSYLGARDMAIVTSPFVSKPIMKHIFSYPSEIRINHELYFRWMKEFMPDAMKYVWENTGLKPRILYKDIKPHSRVANIYRKYEKKIKKIKYERSRNPYSLWIKNDFGIITYTKKYCEERLFLVENNKKIARYINDILESDNIYLLTRAATLLGIVSMCFDLKIGE